MAGNERARIARVLRGHAEASITRVGGPVTRDRAWSVTPRSVPCVWEEECERFPGRSHSCEMGGYAGGRPVTRVIDLACRSIGAVACSRVRRSPTSGGVDRLRATMRMTGPGGLAARARPTPTVPWYRPSVAHKCPTEDVLREHVGATRASPAAPFGAAHPGGVYRPHPRSGRQNRHRPATGLPAL